MACASRLPVALVLTLLLALTLAASEAPAIDDHLLLCEVAVAPTNPQSGEFLEIVNPTPTTKSLAGVYLADDQDYALLPGALGAGPAPSISTFDFIAAFPAEASIPPCGVVVVAVDGAGFSATYGFRADFEIARSDPATPDMLEVAVGGSAGLTDGGESAVLFFWDGSSDLVADLDMVNVGTPTPANAIGDKTGVAVDGPDPGSAASTYAPDAFTMPLQPGDPPAGRSSQRLLLEGPSELSGGGNGVTGDDETSEDILVTWSSSFTAADPGSCPLPPRCYYTAVVPTEPAALRTTLHERIDAHQRLAWGDSIWQLLEVADQHPLDVDSILDLYRNATYPRNRTDYEREHTWPASFGFPEETDAPYTDGHMLFLADGDYNRARSNHPYRSCTGPECQPYHTVPGLGRGGPPPPRENANWESGNQHQGSWETWIGRRGDVARALFYMDVRYEGDNGEPDLILTDDAALIRPTGPAAAEGYMGLLSTLLAWHRADPVDDLERIRNEVVYVGQRNRNPFIDHPEWVECLWGGQCLAEACDAGADAVMLASGRFRVDVCWSVPVQSTSGTGKVVPGAEHVGAFYFFQPSNPELYVKVKNACVEPFGRYWVFAAGLTNVEVRLTVTDTESGLSHTYINPAGQAYTPVQDTQTFDVCP